MNSRNTKGKYKIKKQEKMKITTHILSKKTVGQLLVELTPNMHQYIAKQGLADSADDIIQNASRILFEKNQKENIRHPEAFLIATINNLMIMHFRQRKKDRIMFSSIETDSLECQKAIRNNSYLSAKIEADRQRQIEYLENVMEVHLNTYQYKVLRMKYFDELTYKEMSEQLNSTEDAVRAVSSRAERKLRKILI